MDAEGVGVLTDALGQGDLGEQVAAVPPGRGEPLERGAVAVTGAGGAVVESVRSTGSASAGGHCPAIARPARPRAAG